VAVGMALLAETALPVGLMFRKTQIPTALFGLVFHWVLGLAGFFGFSVTMMALLSLFLVPTASRLLSGYERPYRVWLNRAALLGYVALVLFAKHAFNIHAGWLTSKLFVLLPVVVGVLFWLNYKATREFEIGLTFREALARRSFLFLVPGALALNGLSPFLGFKTEYSYAMYSNLRTEGGTTNHLIWRRPLSLFGYQTDLVRVQSGSDPQILAELGGRPVTRYELTSLLYKVAKEQGRRDIALVLDEGGHTRHTPRAELEPDLVVAPSFWQKRILKFRRIEPPEKGRCAH